MCILNTYFFIYLVYNFFTYFYINVQICTYVYYVLMCMCVHVTYVHVSKYFFMYIFFVCTFVHTCYREEKQPKHKQTNRTEKTNTEGPLSSHLWNIGGSGPIIWYPSPQNISTCLTQSSPLDSVTGIVTQWSPQAE